MVEDSDGSRRESFPAPAKIITIVHKVTKDIASIDGKLAVWRLQHSVNAARTEAAHFAALVEELEHRSGGLGDYTQISRCGGHCGNSSV